MLVFYPLSSPPRNKPQYLQLGSFGKVPAPEFLGLSPKCPFQLAHAGSPMFTDKSLSNHRYILTNHKLRSVGQRGPQRNAEGFLSLCSEDSAKFPIQVSGCPALATPVSRLCQGASVPGGEPGGLHRAGSIPPLTSAPLAARVFSALLTWEQEGLLRWRPRRKL